MHAVSPMCPGPRSQQGTLCSRVVLLRQCEDFQSPLEGSSQQAEVSELPTLAAGPFILRGTCFQGGLQDTNHTLVQV